MILEFQTAQQRLRSDPAREHETQREGHPARISKAQQEANLEAQGTESLVVATRSSESLSRLPYPQPGRHFEFHKPSLHPSSASW